MHCVMHSTQTFLPFWNKEIHQMHSLRTILFLTLIHNKSTGFTQKLGNEIICISTSCQHHSYLTYTKLIKWSEHYMTSFLCSIRVQTIEKCLQRISFTANYQNVTENCLTLSTTTSFQHVCLSMCWNCKEKLNVDHPWE